MSTADVTKAANGDVTAFERLVVEHLQVVHAITLRYAGSLQESEDAAQVAFLTAWRKLGQLRSPDSFGPWIRQIARRSAIEGRRGARRHDGRVTPTVSPEGTFDAPGADEELERRQHQALLREALSALPEDDRELLVLHYREERPIAELAALLEIREDALRQRLSRARRGLRDGVEERLAVALRRTAPGAAFVAAVSAAVRAEPARAAPPFSTSGRLVGAAAALLGAALLAVAGLRGCPADDPEATARAPAAPPAASGVSPSETRRARRNAALVAPEPTPTAGSAPPLVVRVLLGDPGALQRVVGLGAGLTPWQWFPSPDEAPLPDTEVTRALQALLDAEAAPTGDPARLEPLEDRFLDLAARAGGSLDATDDPWATLLALEAERRREQRAWTEVAELSGPLTEARDDREWPEHDLTALSRTAERLRKDHPGTPVADYAALYQLYALQEAGETPPDGISGLLDVVTSSEDPLLEQAVADLLPMALMGEEGTPSTEEREAIERTWDRIDDPASRAGVALAVLGGTIADGDAESTRRWTDRLVSASGELCGTPGPACSLLGPESRRAEGQIAALGGPAPTTWEAALVAGVWSCHLAGTSIPAGGESLTLGDGSGAGWSPISPLSACLAAMPSRPPPPEGRTIRLEVTR